MRTHSYITVFLLAALALRSLLPVGYMVQAAEASEGTFEIVICTSSGLQHITLDEDGKAPQPKSQSVDNGLCPYASGGVTTLAGVAPYSLSGAAEYASVTYKLAAALFAETPKPGATSARGPPSALI